MEYIFSFKKYISNVVYKNDTDKKDVDILANSVPNNDENLTLSNSFILIENPIPKPPPYPNFHKIYFTKEAWQRKLEKEMMEKKDNLDEKKDVIDEKKNNNPYRLLDNKQNNIDIINNKERSIKQIYHEQYRPHIHTSPYYFNDCFGYKNKFGTLGGCNVRSNGHFNLLGNWQNNFSYLGNLPPLDLYKKSSKYKPIKGFTSRNCSLQQPQTRMTSAKYNNKKSGPK